MKNLSRRGLPAALCAASLVLSLLAVPSALPAKEKVALKEVIARVEKAIVTASDLRDAGGITAGKPYRVTVAPDLEMTFSEASFAEDLNRAFRFLGKLKAAAAASSPAAPSAAPPPDRITALRDAERTIPDRSPPPPQDLPLDFNVFQEYQQGRQERIRRQDAAAEADMQSVIAERQAAAAEAQRNRERELQLQAQAMQWQAELDKGAAESARAAAEWQREHSFGAYTRRFLATVVQTGVGAFSSTFFGGIGAELANQAVKGVTKSIYKRAAKKSSGRQASTPAQGAPAVAAPPPPTSARQAPPQGGDFSRSAGGTAAAKQWGTAPPSGGFGAGAAGAGGFGAGAAGTGTAGAQTAGAGYGGAMGVYGQSVLPPPVY